MATNTSTKQSFWSRRRTWIILAGIVLFLPPLSLAVPDDRGHQLLRVLVPAHVLCLEKRHVPERVLMGFLRSYMAWSWSPPSWQARLPGARLVQPSLPRRRYHGARSRIVPRWLKIDFSSIPASPFRYGYLAVYFVASRWALGASCCNYCNFRYRPAHLRGRFS